MDRSKHYLSPAIWLTYLVLFTLAVPWYWAADESRLFLGFPLWVVVSVVVSFLISCFTAWLLIKHWPIEENEGE